MNTLQLAQIDAAKFKNYAAACDHASTFRLNIVTVEGRFWVVDVDSTYQLEQLGYQVAQRNFTETPKPLYTHEWDFS
jgi:hypothetical protein